ncbi:MAG: cyanophycin synthetase [Deltaproteobacteria bacterium]|nr:cyanophycin synthetase [Deltaproteobacteria bacterium]
MELQRARALRGPNIWTRKTALEVTLAVHDAELPAAQFAVFEERLCAIFPALAPFHMGAYEGAGTLARAVERAALALQMEAGCAVSFSRTALGGEPGTFKVVVEYGEEEVGRQALDAAFALVAAALGGLPFDMLAARTRLRMLDEQIRLGPSTGSIVNAAKEAGIPTRRLNDGSLVQLGWGARQRRILAAETDGTSAIAESIAQDKELTKSLMRSVGVPVPKGRAVTDAEDAWAAAEDIGVPVVVKPRYGNQGRGVAVNLHTREQVMNAFAAAKEEGSSIIVERFAPGGDHRLLVIGGRLVAAARREAPKVVGDGDRTIEALVARENANPERGEDHATSLSKIRLDAIALAVLKEQGLTPASVPAKGAVVALRRNANLSTGGSATDVTSEVHPEVAERAIDAARVVGLDICGVDVVCSDISRPLEEQRGCLVEVNAAPGLRMHLEPSRGRGRPVGEAIVRAMFPALDNGRVPLVAVGGTNGKTTTVRLVAHLLRTHGHTVGMSCTDGLYVDDRRIDTGDCSGPKSARALLVNPQVEAAVLETARGGILREGLGFDRCDVAIITNVGSGDHLGMNGISTAEQLAAVKRVIVENVAATGYGVLNAADPLTADMADRCPGSVIFFARDKEQPVLAAHRARGGRVVFVDGDSLVAAAGSREQRVVKTAAVPLTCGGRIPFQVENAMAALAAGWGLGLSWETIGRGLMTFVNDLHRVPGRFNVIDYGGATVVVDYGHNPDAIQALVQAIEHLPAKRRVVMISAAGDRRDVDISKQTEILGTAFDEVVLYEDKCNRGREDGAVLGLLRRGLEGARRTTKITELRGEFLAIETCLSKVRPGDLALLLIDQIDLSVAMIDRIVSRGEAA